MGGSGGFGLVNVDRMVFRNDAEPRASSHKACKNVVLAPRVERGGSTRIVEAKAEAGEGQAGAGREAEEGD